LLCWGKLRLQALSQHPQWGENWRERYSKMTIQLGPIPLLVAIIYLQKAGMIIMGDKTHW
jgi:hypothetical protein